MQDYILNLDKPRKLKYGFKATRLITEKFGGKGLEDLKELALNEFIFIAWAGLIWEDESLTEEKVEQMCDEKIGSEYTQTSIINIIAAAITAHSGAQPVKKKLTTPSKSTVKSRSKSA